MRWTHTSYSRVADEKKGFRGDCLFKLSKGDNLKKKGLWNPVLESVPLSLIQKKSIELGFEFLTGAPYEKTVFSDVVTPKDILAEKYSFI